METIELPTGYLIVDDYSHGKLETLSIGDYGKDKNIKADFLGYSNEVNGVPNGPVKPLQEKWVITLSTQFGCPMKCTFCDVPNVGYHGNATFADLKKQFYSALSVFKGVKYTDRLNIHFARMGEPSFNSFVFTFSSFLAKDKRKIQDETGIRIETIHPVVSTMCPKHKGDLIKNNIRLWAKNYKNILFNGQAGLQLSINSTSNEQRDKMFNGCSMSLEEISEMVKDFDSPLGRKYCLNFAYASGNEVNGEKLAKLFDPDKWMVKITPIHNNTSCRQNNIQTIDGYSSYQPYKIPEENFKNAGFDVLVFVPSQDEEDSCITCGNAILGGSQLKV